MTYTANKSKTLQTTSLCYSIVQLTLSSTNFFSKLMKPNAKFRFCSFFSLFLSSSSPSRVTQKLYGIHVCDYYMYQTISFLLGIYLFGLELHVIYNWFATTLKLSLKHSTFSFKHFWGFCSITLGVACIVRPHPDY